MDLGELIIRVEGDAKPLAKTLDDATRNVSRFAEGAGREFGGMAQQFSQLFTKAVKGDLDGIATALLGLAAEWIKIPGLSKSGSGPSWSGTLGGLFGEGLLSGGMVSALGTLLSGGRAVGGAVAGGAPVLVGERGPELFTPYGSGQVTPNYALRGGAGGNITLNMTVVTPNAQSFRASQGQILADAAQSLARAQRFS